MRVSIACTVLLFAACQATAPRAHESSMVEANAKHEQAKAAAAVASIVDPVALSLAHAAIAAVDHRRRVALENVANADVPGWKRRIAVLRGHCEFTVAGQTFQMPTVFDVVRDHRQGAMQVTQRSLDLAIDGDGFFAVVAPDGSTGYTRAGTLQINADGKLVTSEGWTIVPEITVPSDVLELAIDPTGVVCCRTAGCPDTSTRLGQLTLSRFLNAPGLRSSGALLAGSEAAGNPITQAPGQSGLGLLKQGCIERSNVQLANELLELQAIERQATAIGRVLAPYGITNP